MRMRKLFYWTYVSVAEIHPEKSDKIILLKKLGFIDVLPTVIADIAGHRGRDIIYLI